LYLILDYRYRQRKTTIFTGNLSIEELSMKMKDVRLASRIQHDCKGNIKCFDKVTLKRK
jgi:DNA replication protein DnaC